jgi:hypothetical protein
LVRLKLDIYRWYCAYVCAIILGMSQTVSATKKRTAFFIIVALVLFLGGGALGYFGRGYVDVEDTLQRATAADYAALSQDVRSAKEAGSPVTDNQRLSEQYDTALNEIRIADASLWEQEDIDKAYFALLYADSIDAFTQVQTIYAQLSTAERSGKDIRTNAANVSKEEYDGIIGRALQS